MSPRSFKSTLDKRDVVFACIATTLSCLRARLPGRRETHTHVRAVTPQPRLKGGPVANDRKTQRRIFVASRYRSPSGRPVCYAAVSRGLAYLLSPGATDPQQEGLSATQPCLVGLPTLLSPGAKDPLQAGLSATQQCLAGVPTLLSPGARDATDYSAAIGKAT